MYIPQYAWTLNTFLSTAGAWTASVQNSQQYLGVDLGTQDGDAFIITRVYTQGRQGSDEFVTEFTLEYSMDNRTWAEYTNELGLPEVSWIGFKLY